MNVWFAPKLFSGSTITGKHRTSILLVLHELKGNKKDIWEWFCHLSKKVMLSTDPYRHPINISTICAANFRNKYHCLQSWFHNTSMGIDCSALLLTWISPQHCSMKVRSLSNEVACHQSYEVNVGCFNIISPSTKTSYLPRLGDGSCHCYVKVWFPMGQCCWLLDTTLYTWYM